MEFLGSRPRHQSGGALYTSVGNIWLEDGFRHDLQ